MNPRSGSLSEDPRGSRGWAARGGDDDRGRARCRAAWVALALLALAHGFVSAQPGTVEQVIFQGVLRGSEPGLRNAFGVRAGDPYDLATVRAGFRDLWDTGQFEDITIEAEDGPNGGKVLIVKVKERPTLASVQYEENKVLNRTQIEDRLREKGIKLEPGKPLDIRAVLDTASVIRDALGEKGRLDALVEHELTEATTTSLNVRFRIRPGGKTRIRKIRFVGNSVFKDRKLRKQLKLTKSWNWYWPWTAKNLYHPIKWDQDIESVRTLYRSRGYLDVNIKPPVVEVREVVKSGKQPKKKREPPPPADPPDASPPAESVAEPGQPAEPLSPGKAARKAKRAEKKREKRLRKAEKAQRKAEPKVRKWVYLTAHVQEGIPYKVGEISVSGNTVLDDDLLRSRVLLSKGDVLNLSLVELAVRTITRDYQDRGYAYATARHTVERHTDEEVADIRLTVEEDRKYSVARVEFVGNTSTQDRVLRREFRLHEGALFNRTLLDLSVRKVNQLGYFEVDRNAVRIEPLPGEDRVRITVPGEERGRNEIQVGGGYSGLDGAFFTGFYSTRNFLGRGQILSTSLQIGGRTNRYQVSFQEPWFLGMPYTLGFSLFRRDTDFGGNLRSSGKGGGVVLGRRFGFFTDVFVSYNFVTTSSTGFTLDGRAATNRTSSVTPAYRFNKVNNPFRPTRGWEIAGDVEVAGGSLGGDTSYIRPRLTYSQYARAFRNTFFAIHAEAAMIQPFQGGTTEAFASVNGVPRFTRFWLGGEVQGPRAFETRSITPLRFVRLSPAGAIVEVVRDPTGRPVADFDRNGDGVLNQLDLVEMGGDRFFLFQVEYVFPTPGPLEVAFWLDVGNTMFEDTSWGLEDSRIAAGVEARFYLPVFPFPLRLIYGVPIRDFPEDRTSNFTFSIGRSF